MNDKKPTDHTKEEQICPSPDYANISRISLLSEDFEIQIPPFTKMKQILNDENSNEVENQIPNEHLEEETQKSGQQREPSIDSPQTYSRSNKSRASIKQTKIPSKNEFNQEITENKYYFYLQDAIDLFESNQLTKAKEQLKILLVTLTQLKHITAEKKLIKQMTLIQLEAEYYLCRVYQSTGQLELALENMEEILRKYQIFDLHILAQMNLQLGTLCRLLLLLQKALRYNYEALKLYERLNWPSEQADCMMKLGVVYAMLNEQEIAKKLTYEALSIYKDHGIEGSIKVARAHTTLGKIFLHAKNYEIAQEYLFQSLESHINHYKSEYNYNLIPIYNMLGLLYQLQRDPNEAIRYYKRAVYCFGGTIEVQLGQVLDNLAVAHCEINDRKSAQQCFNQAKSVYDVYFPEQHPLRLRLAMNQKILNQL